MVRTDQRFAAAVEAAVAAIESKSAAEMVVVTSPRSGSYRDLAVLAGAIASVATLAFLCWSPVVFDERWFPIDLIVVGGIVGLLLARSPTLLARLAGDLRRRRQVREAAEAAFVQEAVHATGDRTGLLVYLSVAEERVELLPDQGLLGRIPGSEWNRVAMDARSLDGFLAGLAAVGDLLAAHLPANGERANELPDAPRVRA